MSDAERKPNDAPATVRVRVAVAVAPDGTWRAEGVTASTPAAAGFSADRLLNRAGVRLVWVEATVPVPAAPVVEGVVEGEVWPMADDVRAAAGPKPGDRVPDAYGEGELRCMGVVEGWVVCRRKGAMPTLLTVREWNALRVRGKAVAGE